MGRTALAAAALALLCAGPAAAGVRVEPGRVVVTGAGGSVVAERAPLRLRVLDPSGREALAQVPNSRAAPEPRVTGGPLPLGGQAEPFRQVLSAPFSYTSGVDQQVTWQGLFAGSQAAGAQAGIQYSALDVTSVQAVGAGARLTLSTNDPAGRRIVVDIAPDSTSPEAFSIRARLDGAGGPAVMAASFAAPAGEAFRGFGGQRLGLDLRGELINSWASQTNYDPGPFEGFTAANPAAGPGYQFPSGRTAAVHFPQPQFVSSRGYGFLLDQPELARFRLATGDPAAWNVEATSRELRMVVAPGSAPGVLRSLTRVTGRHAPPATLRDYLANPYGTSKRCGREPIQYFRGFQSDDDATATALNGPSQPPELFYTPLQRGWAAKRADGSPYVFSSVFALPAIVVDYTNPEAAAWWRGIITRELDCGARGFTMDFGEQVLSDMQFADGSDGLAMHNRYPVLYARTTKEAIDAWKGRHPGIPIRLTLRSGYSGRPGTPAYSDSVFHGDFTANWGRGSGIKALITDMLNRSIGGQYGLRCDIGGWNDQYGPVTKELFLRWSEVCALWPFPEVVNGAIYGRKTKDSYDAEAKRVFESMDALHRRAGAYTLALWRQAHRTGMPINRPLWLAYPGDATAARQDQEWMLGPDVLVAPVVEERARSRSVYFPRGCWERPETATVHRGPGSARVSASLGQLPYFFRCGTNPFAQATGVPGCLARRSPIGPRNIGRVGLGRTRAQTLRRVRRVPPILRTRYSHRFCVKGSAGRVTAVFNRRSRRGRAVLVATTARAHGNRRVRPGTRVSALRRAYPRLRRAARGVFRAGPGSPRLIGVRRGRVRWFAVADRRVVRSPRTLRRHLRRAGL